MSRILDSIPFLLVAGLAACSEDDQKPPDGGASHRDAAVYPDAAILDTSMGDVAVFPDAALLDASSTDAISPDAGEQDATAVDSGSTEAGIADSGTLDAGPPPVVAIDFPPLVSETDADHITVRGTASDADGIASVTVNGILAFSTDDFATWSATVSLQMGDQVLSVDAQDQLGTHGIDIAHVNIRRAPLIYSPGRIAATPSGGVLVVEEDYQLGNGAVHVIDVATGVRSGVPGVTDIEDLEVAGGVVYALRRSSVPS